MSNRDFAFSVLGRFLAVECYHDSHQSSSTYPPRTPRRRPAPRLRQQAGLEERLPGTGPAAARVGV